MNEAIRQRQLERFAYAIAQCDRVATPDEVAAARAHLDEHERASRRVPVQLDLKPAA